MSKWTQFITSAQGPLLFLGGLILLALFVFHAVLPPDRLLVTTDDGLGSLALRKEGLPQAFVEGWKPSVLAGRPWLLQINFTNLLLHILPLKFFLNWIHAIDLVLASFFFGLFLRARRCTWPAVVLGSLTAFWLGSTLTLTYAGHIGKYGLIVFAALALWLTEKAARQRSACLTALAGSAMGGMFLEQPDVALFFMLLLGPYLLYAFARELWPRYNRILILMIPAGICLVLLAFRPTWRSYQAVQKKRTVDTDTRPQARWEYATQWSWPPEESIDFIAPGYMGWRSGESKGPYWGRMGRTAGWEESRQGFMNFKLENQYLGLIPLAFALLGAAYLATRPPTEQGRERRRETLFWAIFTILTLLLAFGKYFPVYRLLYSLPGIGSVRNPNKFLQVFQVALGVLTAFGLDLFVRRLPSPSPREVKSDG